MVPPIHAVSSHVATDKGPSIDGGKFKFMNEWMNGFIGIKTNWYTKVKNTYMCPSN